MASDESRSVRGAPRRAMMAGAAKDLRGGGLVNKAGLVARLTGSSTALHQCTDPKNIVTKDRPIDVAPSPSCARADVRTFWSGQSAPKRRKNDEQRTAKPHSARFLPPL